MSSVLGLQRDNSEPAALPGRSDGSGEQPAQPMAAHAATEHQQQQHRSGPDYVFTNEKAGISGVDKERVKQIVYEMSKDSAHFKKEQRKQTQADARIAQYKAQAARLTAGELAGHQRECDAKISLLEAGRDLSRTWLHVDMDAFFASVEELEQPALKNKPMAVGGLGMICTANYEARKYGVRSAMPGFIARKLCPQLVFVKPDFSKYSAASDATRAVFKLYDEHFEAGSLDEAYLDVTDYCSSHSMTAEQVAAELRGAVTRATDLTCSVGIGPNTMLAKIASDRHKPNGQFAVAATREAVMAFLQDLPVRKVPGIGKVSEQTLSALGISCCSQLLQQRALLAALFKPASSNFFLQAGLGLGQTRHAPRTDGPDSSDPGRKGISCERTFAALREQPAMEQMAESLVNHLAADMASEGIEAKTLTLKLKTTAFEVRTRAATLASYASSATQMLPHILKLLRAELPVEIRLMGVRGSGLRRKTGGVLGAAGGRMNALQRMLLQGQQQRQQQEEEEEEDVVVVPEAEAEARCKQQQPGQGRDHQQAQQQQQQQGLQQTGAWSGGGSSRLCFSEGASCDVLAAGSGLALEGHDQQQQQAEEDWEVQSQHTNQQQQQRDGQGWQQWQQLSGQQPDGLLAATEQLHQGLQQQQQQQEDQQQQGLAGGRQAPAPSAKRPRFSPPHRSSAQPIQQQQQQGQQDCWQGREQQEEEQEWQQLKQLEEELLERPQQHQQQEVELQPEDAKNLQQQQHQPAAQHTAAFGSSRGRSGSSSSGSTWTCLACTFSSNRQLILRCEVCDTPKGSSSPADPSWLLTTQHSRSGAQAAAATAAAAVSRGGRSSSSGKARGRGRGRAAAGASVLVGSKRGGRQMTLESIITP